MDSSKRCLDRKCQSFSLIGQDASDKDIPPSGYNTWPLRYTPPGPARYKIAAAISASLPVRSSGEIPEMVRIEYLLVNRCFQLTSRKSISHSMQFRLLVLIRGVGGHLAGENSWCDAVDSHFALRQCGAKHSC